MADLWCMHCGYRDRRDVRSAQIRCPRCGTLMYFMAVPRPKTKQAPRGLIIPGNPAHREGARQ